MYSLLTTMMLSISVDTTDHSDFCRRMNIEVVESQKLGANHVWALLECSEESRTVLLQSKVSRTKRGNCAMWHAQARAVDKEGVDISMDGEAVLSLSKPHGQVCPEFSAGTYVPLQKLHTGDEAEYVFERVISLINRLSSTNSGREAELSHLSLFKRLFSEDVRSLRKALESTSRTPRISLEFIQGGSSESTYVVALQLGNEVWILDLEANEGQLHPNDVAKAER